MTGFEVDIIKGTVLDRIWDDVFYCIDVMLLWGPCNYSTATIPYFKIKAVFPNYKTLCGLDHLSHQVTAFIIREALERL